MADQDPQRRDESKRPDDPSPEMPGFGGVLDGMAHLLGKLGELAEKGEELRRTGQFSSDDRRSVAGEYGFSVKFGPGGERQTTPSVTPMNRPGAPSEAKPAAPEPREPHVDVFPEADHVLVVAEMPGVAVEDISLDFREQTMRIIGKSSRVHFEKSVELGRRVLPRDVETTMNNGVVEIRLQLAGSGDPDRAEESAE